MFSSRSSGDCEYLISFRSLSEVRKMSSPKVPFYYVPRSPPPSLHLLVVQTELQIISPTILAQESINLKQPDTIPRPRIIIMKSKPRARVSFAVHTPLPTVAEPSVGAIEEHFPSAGGSIDSESELESEGPGLEGPESEDDYPADSLINKPKGSYSRPGSGGYSLEKKLKKYKEDHCSLKVRPTWFCCNHKLSLTTGFRGRASSEKSSNSLVIQEAA
jgi:hypothetical protein